MGGCQNRKNTLVLPCLAIISMFYLLMVPLAASITFNYSQFQAKEDNLSFTGDVYHENGVLHLSKNTSGSTDTSSVGRVTHKQLMHLWDEQSGKVADFTTHFSFFIHYLNESYYGTNVGAGITFFMADYNFPLPLPPDASGNGLAGQREMQDSNYVKEHPFVAVEFDTSYNYWFSDPPYDHVGLDINKMVSLHPIQWFSIKDGRTYDAEISYNSSSTRLSVIFTGYKDNVTVQQNYSEMVNLTEYLPERVQFGFSSATSWPFATQALCSWSFNSSFDLEVPTGERKNRLVMWLSIGAGVLVVGFGLPSFVMWKKRRRGRPGTDFGLTLDHDFQRGTGPKKFSYLELVAATNNFSEEQKLGEGGFGGVYKGFIRETNNYVAIKKVSRESRQGVKEYAAEVKIISQLRHRNLVQLIGWCHEKNDLLLIYEFMSNGSLDYHLFKGKSILAWGARYDIARGLASAILYLHEEWERCVVHRDIKSSNVMLDSNFNAKLGDFGLAKLIDHGKRSQTTIVAGTMGYLAPESVSRGKASRESDVYSFGIAALEIACGRKPIDPLANEEQVIMVEWVWQLYGRDNLLAAADPKLCGNFVEQEMERLMIVGLWCAHPDHVLRPTIRQAVHVLNSEAQLPTLPLKMPKLSSFTSSGNFFAISATALGSNQSQVSSRSHTTSSSQSASSSHTTTSSQSATSVLLPPTPLLHTY